MIKSLLKVGLLLVIGILGYNYFYGTAEEKEQSKVIFGKAKDIGKASIDLIKGEVQKFKSGKYDDALDNIGDFLKKAKSTAEEKGGDLVNRMEEWEADKEKWQERKEKLKEMFDSAGEEGKEQMETAIKELNEEGEKLEEKGKKLKEEIER